MLGQNGQIRFAAALVCIAGIFAGDLAVAQSSDFTFRRVKPPAPGTKDRINIQVERTWPYDSPKTVPETESAAADPAALPSETPAAASHAEWFWKEVPSDLAGADPGRLAKALTTISKDNQKRATIAPNPDILDEILKTHGANIMIASAGRRISPAFILAMISVESSGKPQAVSPKGAQGLMQLMPDTAKRFGVDDPSDPLSNIIGGVKYMDWLLDRFKGDVVLALAGYNAGENAVAKHDGVPPFAETRNYIPKVVAAWDKSRLYCQTLPRYVDDGCVFALERSLSR